MMNISPFNRQNKYLRNSAVNYALTYGITPNPGYRYFQLINNTINGDCANFISQCLLAGNAQMELNNEHSWWYKHQTNKLQDTWSLSWTVAHSLYYYLRVNQEENSTYAKGIELATKEGLETGDLIFFQDKNGVIFHSAIVTGFSSGTPLITHHSFEAVNIPYKNSWPAFKYHYLKIVI